MIQNIQILSFCELNISYSIHTFTGGGTLDVSVLWLQGGVFITQAMAGNNRLGGQDFNNNVQKHVIKVSVPPVSVRNEEWK